jgi:hypothetical protein
MGNRFVSANINTELAPVPFREAVVQAFRPLGGIPQMTQTGFTLQDGKYGISSQSLVNLMATVMLRKLRENNYEVQIYLNWSWGSTMWILLILGIIFGGVPWLFMLLYLMFDPTTAYQQALVRLQYTLEPQFR